MPHDAATYYPPPVGLVKTPIETFNRVKDEVGDARVEYRQSRESSYSQYRNLTAGTAIQVTPDIASFNPATKVMDPEQTPFSLIITGTGFSAVSKVWWDGLEYTPSAWTATTLTVTVPAAPAAWAYSVYVMNEGNPSNVKKYKFTAATRSAKTVEVIKQAEKV